MADGEALGRVQCLADTPKKCAVSARPNMRWNKYLLPDVVFDEDLSADTSVDAIVRVEEAKT